MLSELFKRGDGKREFIAGSHTVLKPDPDFSGTVFNRDHHRDLQMKIVDRFCRKNHGTIFQKKSRSGYEKLTTYAHTSRSASRRQPHPRGALSIAIRFLKKNQGSILPEKSRIDFKMKIGYRFFRSEFRSRSWLRFAHKNRGAVVTMRAQVARSTAWSAGAGRIT